MSSAPTAPGTPESPGSLPSTPSPPSAAGTGGPGAGAPPSLTQRTGRGVVWTVLQVGANKLTSVVGQVILAWILDPSDFALVGLVYSVVGLTSILQNPGIDSVLIQRGNFRRWSNIAFWLSLTFGLGAGLVMVAAAPVGAWKYQAPQLVGLISLVGLRTVIDAAGVVPAARLQHDLRFGFLSVLGSGVAVATTLLTILLALMHLGAYSFFLPLPIVAAVRTLVLWRAAPDEAIRWRLEVGRWRFVLGQSGYLLGGMFCASVVLQGDYMILGAMYPDQKQMLGVYFLAFTLAQQMLQLLWNFTNVLFPALSQLQHDRARQYAAFIRSCRLLLVLGVPTVILQAATAAPVIHLLFRPVYHPAVPMTQILSVAMGLALLGMPSMGLMKANGRFSAVFWSFLVYMVTFLAVVFLGARWGQALGVSIAVGLTMGLSGPMMFRVATAPLGGTWGDLAKVLLPPLTLGLAAFLPPVILCEAALPGHGVGHWVTYLAIVLLGGGSIYALLLRVFQANTYRELLGLVRQIRKPRSAG